MEKTTKFLNQQVANWNIMFVKLHNYHWYVKGEQFFVLHEKFEALYDLAAEQIDVLAERILALKGRPAGTLKEYLEITNIKEATGKEDDKEMVKTIAQDFSNMAEELKKGIEIAQSEDDESTADMFIETVTELEKQIWMLTSFLG